MRKQNTKHSLVMSVISLLLCFSMLLGTTFAWFTDSVTSSNNIIKSGTLDVEMYYADGTKVIPADDSADWSDASTGAIFNYDKWEPGYVDVRHIKILNVGTLALKYQLNVVANGTVSDLADVIDVYFVDGGKQIENRSDLVGYTPVGNLTSVLAGMPGNASGTLLADNDAIVTIALKMQETAGNEYQNKAIGTDFSVQLVATQLTFEEDSFDDQYDADAEFSTDATTASELATALAAGGKVKLASDITLTEAPIIPADADVVLNLNGKKLTAGDDGYVVENYGKLVLTGNGNVTGVVYTGNGGETTIKDGTYNAPNGKTFVILNYSGTLTIDGGTINSGGNDYPIYSFNDGNKLVINDVKINGTFGCVNAYGANSSVVINGGTFEMTGVQGMTSHITYFSAGINATINGGTFKKIGDISMSSAGGGGICVNGGASLTINDGNYAGDHSDVYNYGGTINIKGGTYKFEPKLFDTNIYQATKNADGTYTVTAK